MNRNEIAMWAVGEYLKTQFDQVEDIDYALDRLSILKADKPEYVIVLVGFDLSFPRYSIRTQNMFHAFRVYGIDETRQPESHRDLDIHMHTGHKDFTSVSDWSHRVADFWVEILSTWAISS